MNNFTCKNDTLLYKSICSYNGTLQLTLVSFSKNKNKNSN